jgi:hypothetical protein
MKTAFKTFIVMLDLSIISYGKVGIGGDRIGRGKGRG